VPEETVAILCAAGAWLKRNRDAVTQSERHPLSWNCTARPITRRDNRVYLHFMKDPGGSFCWAELKNRVLSARLLDGGQPVPFRQEGDRLFLDNLPHPMPDPIATTIELELDDTPQAITEQSTFWIPG
jgi:alpha-L-fucosidase